MNLIKVLKGVARKNPPLQNAKSLKIGVIGAGTQGSLLSETAEEAGAKIVAVHDVNLVRARKLALIHKAELATDNLDNFFKINMDGLLICTKPKVRLDPIRRACKNKIHLLIEKPPAYNLTEGQECLNEINKADVISSVGFQLRYEPRYERLKQLIKGHDIHLVRTVCTVDYFLNFQMPDWFLMNEESGGPIAEQAIHLLDIVRYVLDNPKATQAISLGIRNMAYDRTEYTSENATQLIYKLNNGVLGVHTNHSGYERPHFDLEFIGPHLRLHANATEKTIHGIINGKKINEITPQKKKNGLNKVSAWLKAIETNDKTYIRSDFVESLNTQALVDAAIKSQKTKTVEIIK